MDSLSQMALGAAIGTAVLGRRVGVRAAVWGAAMGTLPDLDVLVSHGDPVRDFTFHRATSHSLFWLTLLAPALAAGAWRLHRQAGASYRAWLALTWLALVTHPLLDAFTVYGTQLLLPFTDYPVGLGSIFIIDPAYTLPLLAGVAVALARRRRDPAAAMRANAAGLALSTLYLGWSVGAQAHVEGVVQRSLGASPLASGRVLVTPTPFNTLLWRVVIMDDDSYHEGFRSLLDGDTPLVLERHESDRAALGALEEDWAVRRLAWFSKGFYRVSVLPGEAPAAVPLGTRAGPLATAEAAGRADVLDASIVVTDLRMGQTPWFVFSFVVGAWDGGGATAVPSVQLDAGRPPAAALRWLWSRAFAGVLGDHGGALEPPPGDEEAR